MLRWTAGMAGAVWVLTLMALAGADRAPTLAPRVDPPHVPRAPAPLVGFALNAHYMEGVQSHLDALDELAALRVDAIEILTPIIQTDGASTDLRIDPQRCPTPAQLRRIIEAAHERDLQVALMPIVLFAEPRGNEWRGKIQPEQWDSWWQRYTQVMLRFAELARDTDVEILSVGSELLSTERQTERWSELIQQVRAHYDGQLLYSTNWDHYFVPGYWDQLDLIGINGYWELARSTDVTDEALTARWRDIRSQVTAFARQTDRPVLFTEVGYPSLSWALKDPWNYVAQGEAAAPRVQARGLAAFINAWSDMLDGQPTDPNDAGTLAGVMFYEWDLSARGGPTDTGYGIRGKPALQLMRDWLGSRKEATSEGAALIKHAPRP